MALRRTEHWDTRELHDFLLARRDAPFRWGEHDCCLFVADAIQSFTGVDLAMDFRGKYSTREGALEAIRSIAGGSSVADAVAYCAAKAGLQELRAPLYAQRGDMVLVEDDAAAEEGIGTLIAGIVHLNGRHVAVAGAKGLKRAPIECVRRAWRV